MEPVRIKYSAPSVSLVMLLLTGICFFLASEAFSGPDSFYESLPLVVLFIIFLMAAFSWTTLFFIPMLSGLPALEISGSAIFIRSIGQQIPWTEIREISTRTTKTSFVVKIFVNDEEKVFQKPRFFSQRLICALNLAFDSTSFCFHAWPLSGTPMQTYELIKSRHTASSLNRPVNTGTIIRPDEH